MSKKTSHTIRSDENIWERMPWDSAAGYTYFSLYYFPQPAGKRSLIKAYETKTGKKVTKAPANWGRYYRGQTGRGAIQYYQVFDVVTGELSPPRVVPTWKERAEAFDAHIFAESRRRIREMYDKDVEEILKASRAGVKALIGKVVANIAQHNPTGDESIGTLSASLLRAIEAANAVYGLEMSAGNPPRDMDGADSVAGNDITLADRVEAIAKILSAAEERKKRSKGTP